MNEPHKTGEGYFNTKHSYKKETIQIDYISNLCCSNKTNLDFEEKGV